MRDSSHMKEEKIEIFFKAGLIAFAYERFDLSDDYFSKIQFQIGEEKFLEVCNTFDCVWVPSFLSSMKNVRQKLEKDPNCGWNMKLVDYVKTEQSHEWGFSIKNPGTKIDIQRGDSEHWFRDNPFLLDRYKDLKNQTLARETISTEQSVTKRSDKFSSIRLAQKIASSLKNQVMKTFFIFK